MTTYDALAIGFGAAASAYVLLLLLPLLKKKSPPPCAEVVRLRVVHLRCPVCAKVFEDNDLALRVPGEPLVHSACSAERSWIGKGETVELMQTAGKRER